MSVHVLLDANDPCGIPALVYADEEQRWYAFGEETVSTELVLAIFLMAAGESEMGQA